ncbi:hypothetical protein Cob_v001676 [Colletotrichum orbiculare MAFF 240422]|uniref:Uncharacterized protein n=1 Tax=Colletotrichum orbiculare (strain 104-T / ATCC 96160 / CBS 514.97 / LARS 414 / MAFF 240422) TaxID=1213857 RepID=A0A484G6I8_COLOR|nr:hypothetical protein Cob_v001676 [Colletotrichum orbiculare MAFF 240422]
MAIISSIVTNPYGAVSNTTPLLRHYNIPFNTWTAESTSSAVYPSRQTVRGEPFRKTWVDDPVDESWAPLDPFPPPAKNAAVPPWT